MTKYNVLLEELILNSKLNEKDSHDIRSIFFAVTDEKKQNILDNWEFLILQLRKIEQDLIEEQKILFGKALDDIDDEINNVLSSDIHTKEQLDELKSLI